MSNDYNLYRYPACGHIYNEAEGWPADDIPPAPVGPMYHKTGSAQSVTQKKII